MGLFGAKKTNVTHLNHKEEYYNAYYFNHKLCDGVDIVALIERTTKKQAAEMLMKAGLSSYMGENSPITFKMNAPHTSRTRKQNSPAS